MVGVGAAGGGEEAEGPGDRILEEPAPCAGGRAGTSRRRGGAAHAEGRGQVLRHVARVGHGDADRHCRGASRRREAELDPGSLDLTGNRGAFRSGAGGGRARRSRVPRGSGRRRLGSS